MNSKEIKLSNPIDFFKFQKRYKIDTLSVKEIKDIFNCVTALIIKNLGKEFTETLYTRYDCAYTHINNKYTKQELLNYLGDSTLEFLNLENNNNPTKADIISILIRKVELEEFLEIAFTL